MPASERSQPSEIRTARERLTQAGGALRGTKLSERTRALGRVLDRLREPDSEQRRRLERELPETTGLAAETVREGLALALSEFSARALDALVAHELGGGDVERLTSGFDVTTVVLGGGVPTPMLLALATPLLLGSPVLARSSAHDPSTARIFASALGAEAPELAGCLALVSFPSDDEAALRELLAAPCVVAYGSDQTMATLAARLAPAQHFVRHGQRLSVAVLGAAAQGGAALTEAAAALARDVALWDQLGCLSPVALYVLGAERVSGALLAELEAAFEAAARRWPRGRVPAEAHASAAAARDTAELRAAAGADVRVRAARDFTLVAEPDAVFRGSPLYRFVRIHPVPNTETLLAALAPLAPHLAAVGVGGLGEEREALEAGLARLGAGRVCPLGRLQAPPLGWSHEGRGVLLPLLRTPGGTE